MLMVQDILNSVTDGLWILRKSPYSCVCILLAFVTSLRLYSAKPCVHFIGVLPSDLDLFMSEWGILFCVWMILTGRLCRGWRFCLLN